MAETPKVALITGASSGMGEATAVRLAKEGFKVVLAARRQDRLAAVAERVRQTGGEPLICPTDVTRLEDIQALVGKAVEAFGRIDVFFNNAGNMRTAPIEDLPHEAIADMVNVNLLGAFRMIKEVVPILKRQNSGLIINIASVLGRKTRSKAWVYAGTKWAITAMSEGLREELVGTRVRVCCLAPGVVDTELFNAFAEHPAKWQKITEMLKPQEIADFIAYVVNLPWHVNINEVILRPTEQIV